MTGKEFKELRKGAVLYVPADDDEERAYTVLEKDKQGRIKMQRVLYEIDHHAFWGEEYDNYDEAMDALRMGRDEDIDCGATSDDIRKKKIGEPFWMDYRNVEIDFDF